MIYKIYYRTLAFSMLLLFFLVSARKSASQSNEALKQIVPPSPEAVSILRYGNSGVNYYTGAPSFSIPLFEFSGFGVRSAVALNYSSFNGIKVEEIAGSTGLGWSLNAGGVISRTVNGIADDRDGTGNKTGYLNVPKLRWPTVCVGGVDASSDSVLSNFSNYFSAGVWDGQPDTYRYSVGGLSGSFYINQDKKIIYKPETDVKIKPIFSGQALVAFELLDVDGTRYYFDEQEKTRNVNLPGPVFDDYYNTVSWYLKTVHNSAGKLIASFEYLLPEAHETYQLNQSPFDYSDDDNPQTMEGSQMSYFRLYTKTPFLSKIVFDNAEVRLAYQSSARKDLQNGVILDSVVISDKIANIIKAYSFHYTYFDNNSVTPLSASATTVTIGAVQAPGDPYKRLKLDSLCEWSGDLTNKLRHWFKYETSVFLPSKYSFAQDHWGYYNGKNSNTSLEHRHREFFVINPNTTMPQERFYDWGTANRQPNVDYSKAAILKEIVYPTSGFTRFEYEEHTVADSLLPNDTVSRSINITTDEVYSFLRVKLVNNPFAYLRVNSIVADPCFAEVEIRDSATNELKFAFNRATGNTGDSVFIIKPGIYKVKAKRQSYTTTCYPEGDLIRFYWGDEVVTSIDKVGGLRIKRITDYTNTDTSTFASRRRFFYNESGDTSSVSLPTSKLISIPRYSRPDYGGWDWNAGDELMYCELPNTIGTGFIRKITSAYPLVFTNGSPIAYRKVTVVNEGATNNGKTEYTFTTGAEYPDIRTGFFNNELSHETEVLINGTLVETAPYAPEDDRDYMRGQLLKESYYKYDGSGYSIIKKIENTVTPTFPPPLPTHQGATTYVTVDGINKILGQVFRRLYFEAPPGSTSPVYTYWGKQYYIYSGRMDITRKREALYQYNSSGVLTDSIIKTTDFTYGDTPLQLDSLFHTQVTKQETTGSDNVVETITYKYPYHKAQLTGLTGAQQTAIDSLMKKNVVGVALEVETSKGATLINTVRNNFKIFNGDVLPADVQQAFYSNSLRSLVNFNEYNASGNLLEQQKTDDFKKSYVWGYNEQLPIAEVINASVKDIFHTSFEDADGNSAVWDSRTGEKSRTGGYSKSLTGLTNGSYSLSYWQKTGGSWALQSSVVVVSAGSYTISLSGQVDEVRFYPLGAQMTTYTYRPTIGMLSQTDVNNRINYYEYDAFGRLSLVRDQDKNVLKKFCYNYAGQAEDCGLVTYSSAAASGTFTRNNCGTNGTGSSVTYTVNAGAYTSTISQADADQQATADVNNNGQAHANFFGSCTWTNEPQSGSFTRNDCGINGTGSSITYTVAAGTYSSTVSLADANQQATNAVNAGGQAYANTNAGCSWTNQAQSGPFTRNDCTEGGTGGTVTYTINAGTYSSTVSLADANQQALNAVNAGGQAYANSTATCTWTNDATTASYTRNNCGAGYVGGTLSYTVNAGAYSSTVSKADANQQAIDARNSLGQANANANAGCTLSVYAKLSYENYNYSYSNAVHADVIVRFYSDAACTQPVSVTSLTINLSTEGFDGSSTFSYDFSETANGTYHVLGYAVELSYDDGSTNRFRDYYLLGGSFYTVVW